MTRFFQHPMAVVENGAVIGQGTRIWAFAHVLSGAVIGEDCNICDHTFIEGQVRIGNRVTIKCGVYLWDGLILEDDVFIGPSAVFTNDLRPRSRKPLKDIPQTLLQQGCTIGANSTTLPGLTIGRWAMVAAGAVVTHNVPDFGLVRGAPARLVGWVCRCGEKLSHARRDEWRCVCGAAYRQLAPAALREIEPGEARTDVRAGRTNKLVV
jgi:UDP-2-acetamido-3-amino-2,3-dideoxy-glucuronate N-acetyltransferase